MQAIGAEGIEKNGNLAKGVTKPTEATPVLGTTSTQSELPTISRSLPGESTREDSEAPTVEYLPGKMTVESSKSEPSMQSISSSLPGKTADNASRVESGKSGNEQILPGKMTLETSEEQILPGKMTLETSKEQALPGKMTLETLKESHTGLTSQEPANSLKDTTGGNLIDSKHEGNFRHHKSARPIIKLILAPLKSVNTQVNKRYLCSIFPSDITSESKDLGKTLLHKPCALLRCKCWTFWLLMLRYMKLLQYTLNYGALVSFYLACRQ